MKEIEEISKQFKKWKYNGVQPDFLDELNQTYYMLLCLTDFKYRKEGDEYLDYFKLLYNFNKEFDVSYQNYCIIKELVRNNLHEILEDILLHNKIELNDIDLLESGGFYEIDPETINLLVEYGFDISYNNYIIIRGLIERDKTNEKLLNIFRSHKININADNGIIFLEYAIKWMNYESFMFLIGEGADILIDNCLFECAIDTYCSDRRSFDEKSIRKILEYFIMNGVDINANSKLFYKTILYGDLPLTKLLIEHGMNLGFIKTDHELLQILSSGNIEIIDILVQNGIDFTRINSIPLSNSQIKIMDSYNYLLELGIKQEILFVQLSKFKNKTKN